ncbi:hypothetical protein GCM10017764_29530 [Sphingobacterium griseoflavum]|uniref:Uncharacterized protein n=1 Tax=Sphingobacterium griseoflavum TaxID=1474952 RepID=A0ABQ3I0I4_9SPHI|nr:hypothetical protein GCM10017764_29530 [Sphingobacterium griseoflavum]
MQEDRAKAQSIAELSKACRILPMKSKAERKKSNGCAKKEDGPFIIRSKNKTLPL